MQPKKPTAADLVELFAAGTVVGAATPTTHTLTPASTEARTVRTQERCCGSVLAVTEDRARILWTDDVGGETYERFEDLEVVEA